MSDEEIMNKQPIEYVSRAAEIDKAIEELNADLEKAEDPAEKKKIAKLLKKLIVDVESATEFDRANKAKIDAYNEELEQEQQKAYKRRIKLGEEAKRQRQEKLEKEREEKKKPKQEVIMEEDDEDDDEESDGDVKEDGLYKLDIEDFGYFRNSNVNTGVRLSNIFVSQDILMFGGGYGIPIAVDVNGVATQIGQQRSSDSQYTGSIKFINKDNKPEDRSIRLDKEIIGIYNPARNAFVALFQYTRGVGRTMETYDSDVVRALKRIIILKGQKRVSKDVKAKTADIERGIQMRKQQEERDDKKEMEKKLKKLDKETDKLKKEYDKLKKEDGDKEERKKLAKKYNEGVKKFNDLRDEYNAYFGKKGTGIVDNPELYEKAKAYADNIFKKPSAYKSGFIVKKYKELGGTYSGDKPEKTGIARWFKEEWTDIGNKEYPVYRPTKRITKKTPLTPEEIKPSNLKKQIALKQEIKGDANLPPFVKKGGKLVSLVSIEDIPKTDAIWEWSNPNKVAEKAKEYLGKDAVIFRADKPKKKYMVFDPNLEKWIYFGEMSYQDHTKHNDPIKRKNYLRRTANMKGDWKDNKYSANNLSRAILW